MLRFLKVQENKPIQQLEASENMTSGMAVTIDFANDEVDKATATTGIYLVDSAPNYNGINAVVGAADDAFEAITDGDKVNVIPTFIGERYATDQFTLASAVKGDYLKAASGLFVEAAGSDICEWIYGGTYSDPTGTMYIIERVAPATV